MFPYSEGSFEDRNEIAIFSSFTDTEQMTPSMEQTCVTHKLHEVQYMYCRYEDVL